MQEKSIQLQNRHMAQIDSSESENTTYPSAGEWRFELRVRYLPTDLTDLYDRDKVTFGCYYDQVNNFL